jgi:hypothetical protein
VVIGAGVVFAEPGMDQGMVGRLVVDPQEDELLRLETGLKFEGGELKGNCVGREWFRLDCDCSEERVHLASTIIHRVFIDKRCCL